MFEFECELFFSSLHYISVGRNLEFICTCFFFSSFFIAWDQLPGGYSLEFLVGVCLPVLQIHTQFQTKKCHFPHPFSDQTSKIHTRFQTWPLGRNYVIIPRLQCKQKNYSNPFRILIFLFLSHLELKR